MSNGKMVRSQKRRNIGAQKGIVKSLMRKGNLDQSKWNREVLRGVF
jgi:hypothetical protein